MRNQNKSFIRLSVRRVLVLIQVVGAGAPTRQAHAARTNKLQENERKSNASFAADPLGESTQFFFDSPKFSFYALNANCYSTNRECVCFFVYPLSAGTTPILIFCFKKVCLLVFSVLSFPLMKYSSEFFSLNFSLFLRVLYFSTVFCIF